MLPKKPVPEIVDVQGSFVAPLRQVFWKPIKAVKPIVVSGLLPTSASTRQGELWWVGEMDRTGLDDFLVAPLAWHKMV